MRETIKLSIIIVFSFVFIVPSVIFAASYNTETFLSKIDSGHGENADEAYIDEPQGFDLSSENDIYLTDTANNKIEKIGKNSENLSTIAGTGEYGYVNGFAPQAQFANPQDVVVRGDGEQIFVADTNNNVIRKIENNQVSTFLEGLKQPKGLYLYENTLFVADSGNNRILAVDRNSGQATTLVTGLSHPTKLIFHSKARSIIFVNFDKGNVRSYNIDTKQLSGSLISGLEDIGGVHRKGRTLYVFSSYSIGVFNEIWKVRLKKPSTTESLEALSTKRLTNTRETEHLNWSSDGIIREDVLTWEEYYSWDQNLLYETAAKKKKKAKKLKFKKQGKKKWRTQWYTRVNPNKKWQEVNFVLKKEHQGDQPYFRVRLEYDNQKWGKKHRENVRDKNLTGWKKSETFSTGLRVKNRKAQKVTLDWEKDLNATSYNLQLWKVKKGKDERVLSRQGLTKTKFKVKKKYLKTNQRYKFRVRSCAGEACEDWSEFYEFRTKPTTVKQVLQPSPTRGVRMTKLKSGDYLATLKFNIRSNKKKNNLKNLRAKVQLLSKNTKHAKKVKTDRIYVLYKGGSSILAWRINGKLPKLYAGKHRFQDEYGSKDESLVGRPKALAFSSDGNEMYIFENNKIAVYDFDKKELSEVAGHLMDSYTEGTGDEVRFSDVVDMDISSDNKWLYLVDRNNHRIRKLNTKTKQTFYITGAGGTNFSFKTLDSNGYQEGGPCATVFDLEVSGCAYFNRPTGIAISPDNKTLYIAEGSNNRIRAVKVDTGQTSLVAGSGASGYKNGVGSNAQFNGPYTLDISDDGSTLYVADKYNHAIRAVNVHTKNVTTLVGNGKIGNREGSFSKAVLAIPEYVHHENGKVYWTEAGTHTVREANLSTKTVSTISGNGNKGYKDGAGSQAEWNNPKGMDIRGNKMYVADYSNDLIRTIKF